MTTKALVHPLLAVLSSFIEFIFKPYVRQPRPSAPQAETPTEIFENDARETVREIEERKPEPPSSPEIVAERGICLHKSVKFRTRAGNLCSAKVMGYSWEDPTVLLLSRNGGPLFKRRLC